VSGVVLGAARVLYLLALGLWVGEIAFFSFVAAPAIFGVLDTARAGQVVGAIFPRYYALGTAAAATALGCGVVLTRRAVAPGWWRAAVVSLALGLAATLWAGQVVHPRAQHLRAALAASGAAPSENSEFQRAHRLAVVLNGVALLAGVVGLGLSAAALRQ
jgi:uncharacterized membrane protein